MSKLTWEKIASGPDSILILVKACELAHRPPIANPSFILSLYVSRFEVFSLVSIDKFMTFFQWNGQKSIMFLLSSNNLYGLQFQLIFCPLTLILNPKIILIVYFTEKNTWLWGYFSVAKEQEFGWALLRSCP